MNYTVGIMGSSGFVGGAIKRYFQKINAPLRVFDKYKNEGSMEEIQQADVVFVAVPTPFDEVKGGFDLSFVSSAVEALVGNKIVVIKSTILPGTTERFQRQFPHHKFIFNPEFLTQSTADNDMQYPDRQIIGYTKESYTIAGDVMRLLPLAPFEKIVPATEAEMIKYFNNTWFATKVTFANQMYELCSAMNLNFEVIRECAAMDKRVGPSHLDVHHGGYRGYGGACLPKDTRALIQLGDAVASPMELLKKVEELNNRLRAKEEATNRQEIHTTDNQHIPRELETAIEAHINIPRGA